MGIFEGFRMSDEDSSPILDEKFKSATIDKFLTFCEKSGLDVEPADAFQKMGIFSAEVIAKFCPLYYEEYSATRYRGPKRGILIYGEVGRGKTVLARACYEFLNRVFKAYIRKADPGARLFFIYQIDFTLNLATKGPEYIDKALLDHRKSIYFFDDIGNDREANVFGNRVSSEDIIQFREVCRQEYGVPSVFTTNLNFKDIQARYGAFNLSRIGGGYDGIFFDYPHDRRITNGNETK